MGVMTDQLSLTDCPRKSPKARLALGYPPAINNLFKSLF